MNKINNTIDKKKRQQAKRNYYDEIEKYMPENLEESAKEQKALIRKREIKSASELLQMLLIYAVSQISFKMLSLSAAMMEVAQMSDKAWQKRMSKSVNWLRYILNCILQTIVKKAEPYKRNINLFDASTVSQEGKGKIYRIHTNFGLTQNTVNEVKVTDSRTAESFEHYTIKKDDIIHADAVYSRAKNIAKAYEAEADVIIRMSPHHMPVYDKYGEKIDIREQLKKAEKAKKGIVEIKGFIHYNEKRYQVRIISSRLPEEKALLSREKKERKAKKNGNKIMPQTLEYASWVILATSLGVDYFAEEILHMYRSRWQVELLFKRLKQSLKIHKLRPSTDNYALALIYMWLIVWALTERQVGTAEIIV